MRFPKQQLVWPSGLGDLGRDNTHSLCRPRTPGKGTKEKPRTQGCSPWARAPKQGSQGPVWAFLLSSVAALPGLAIPLGDKPEVSPERSSPPELGPVCEKSQGDPRLLCHPKSSASCHWPFTRVREVTHCVSEGSEPSRPGAFLGRLGEKSPGRDC